MDRKLVEVHRSRSALHEQAASAALQQPQTREWSIVIHFYSALHLVEAFLRAKGENIGAEDHGTRWRLIRQNRELSEGRGQQFRTAYKRLWDSSSQVRYDPWFVAREQDIESLAPKVDRLLQ
ncbi:MAG: hypothetical protein WBV82_30645 [Myxococcaceae bacterium]